MSSDNEDALCKIRRYQSHVLATRYGTLSFKMCLAMERAGL